MSELNNFIDADTILVSACMVAQHNYMVYDKKGNKLHPTKSKKQWCKDNAGSNPDDFEFRKEATLITNGREPAINICKHTVIANIRRIEAKYPDYKTWVCIEGQGNFREDLYPNYKGNRDGSILLRSELSEWVRTTFPRVIVSQGCETDDTVARFMWKGYRDFQRTGTYTNMVSGCDKDLRTVAGKIYNYCKDKELIITELEADRWFCTQLLMGDSIDNIKGINKALSKDFLKERGVRPNGRGVGQKTAESLLASCKTSAECFAVVVECYKHAHEGLWLQALQEEALALRMCHSEAETRAGSHYKIVNHMDHLGVKYD